MKKQWCLGQINAVFIARMEILLKPGDVKKEHYEYEKNGACVVLSAIEPLTGQRFSRVFSQRRKVEYAQFMQEFAQLYSQAKKIRLVQDNLNTHNASSFYQEFVAEEALALAQRFEFYYTPTSGSWLNMIEIEFSALAKQCLNRRIATQDELEKELLAWTADRNRKAVKINWQFSIQTARSKLNRHYKKLNPSNSKYKVT
ncbi:MAG: IS630 family transposase [Anaerolineae bacterium]|nr:IS630 family transposase [Anaerolineae bacterium]